MKIQFSVNVFGQEGFDRLADLPVVPRIGENVSIDGDLYKVHAVDWYPFGDDEVDQDTTPFVYVVLRK